MEGKIPRGDIAWGQLWSSEYMSNQHEYRDTEIKLQKVPYVVCL